MMKQSAAAVLVLACVVAGVLAAPPQPNTASFDAQNNPLDEEGEIVSCKAKVDMVIVLDGSKSMRRNGFEEVRDYTLRFAELFDIAPEHINLGVVQFTWQPFVEQALTGDSEEYTASVEAMPYRAWYPSKCGRLCSGLGVGMRSAYEMLKESPRAGEAFRVILMLTDGRVSIGEHPKDVYAEIQENDPDILVVGIGIGNRASKSHIEQWVSHQENEDGSQGDPYVLMTRNHNKIDETVPFVYNVACVCPGEGDCNDRGVCQADGTCDCDFGSAADDCADIDIVTVAVTAAGGVSGLALGAAGLFFLSHRMFRSEDVPDHPKFYESPGDEGDQPAVLSSGSPAAGDDATERDMWKPL